MKHFSTFFELGYEHIVSLAALDHILFIMVLMAAYAPKKWLKILVLISLFTLGHTAALIFSGLNLVKINSAWIEFLIPLTIVITALYNLSKAGQQPKGKAKNWIALVFGIIHGLGFSNYFLILIAGTMEYWNAIIPFTLGVEVGQLVIALAFLLLMVIFQVLMRKKQRDWNFFFSGAAFGLALMMCVEKWPG